MKPYYEFACFDEGDLMSIYLVWQDFEYGQPVAEVHDSHIATKEQLAERIVEALNADEEWRQP